MIECEMKNDLVNSKQRRVVECAMVFWMLFTTRVEVQADGPSMGSCLTEEKRQGSVGG